MRGYKAHMIAPFKVGVDKAQEPWLTPDEAFVELENIYSKDGVLKKRGGTSVFGQLGRVVSGETYDTPDGGKTYGKTLANPTPIFGSLSITSSAPAQTVYLDQNGVSTGDGTAALTSVGVSTVTFTSVVSTGTIKCTYHYSDTGTDRVVRGIQLFNKDSGSEELLAIDKRRLSTWNTTYKYFDNVASGTAVTDEAWDTGAGGGATKTYNKSGAATSNIPLVPFTVRIHEAVTSQELFDNGYGVFVETQEGSGSGTGTGTVNYTTGKISVTFETAIGAGDPIKIDYYHTATPVYDTWNSANLMWNVSWQNLLWLTDDASHIYIYNAIVAGKVAEQSLIDITPRMVLDAAGANFLLSARCMVTLQGRPIFFNTIETDGRHSGRARWPAAGNSLTVDAWRDDIDGYGDYSDAPTNDEIITSLELPDRAVVFFENDIGFFIYTKNPSLPYSWKMLESDLRTDSTFGIWRFKNFVTSIGKFSMNTSDGNGAEESNKKIPDFTLDIDYDYINKCYGHVIQEKKLAWLAYPSRARGLGYPDKVLIYNYEDNIISQYDLTDIDGAPLPVRCLGDFSNQSDATYGDLNDATFWPDVKSKIDLAGRNAYFSDYRGLTYEELAHQSGSQIVLAGGNDGYVYHVDNDAITNDNGYGYDFAIVTKKYNPYKELGVGVSLGYVDFLVTVNASCKIEVKFYLGFTDNPTEPLTKTFTCNGSGNKVWKRAYCNATSDVIGYRISTPDDQDFKEYSFELHSHTPYFKSGGKII